jgi:DNA-binding SARP family transcriptional activator
MARLSLTLLGGFAARVEDGKPVGLSIRKGQALLAYLAMPTGRAHLRDKLATLLWGDLPEPSARKGLRQTLFVLGQTLGEANPLRLDGESVVLEPADVATDVSEFEACAAGEDGAALERAAAIYRGDLLQGLALREPGFEEWVVSERMRLRELALDGMARLLAQQQQARAQEPAMHTALRILALDPIREPVHRAVMRLQLQLGRRAEAMRQYQLCAGILRRELRAEPEAETKALYREIARRRSPSGTAEARADQRSPLPAPPRRRGPPPAPALPRGQGLLVGRTVELEQLRVGLEMAWGGAGRVASVIGEAGIG